MYIYLYVLYSGGQQQVQLSIYLSILSPFIFIYIYSSTLDSLIHPEPLDTIW